MNTERELFIKLNLITFLKFFVVFFTFFFFYNQNSLSENEDTEYKFTPYTGLAGKNGFENTIIIKDECEYHIQIDNDFIEHAEPNCIFKAQINEDEKYHYSLGRKLIPEKKEYIFFWGESELRTNLFKGKGNKQFKCEKWCAIDIKFWFNNHSSGIMSSVPRYGSEILGTLKNSNIKKDKDILISLSNCEPKRFHYLQTWINKIRNEIPNLNITLCGRCFGENIDPECPPRNKIWNIEHLLWIKRHKFVTAIENSICDNYVTEKLMNAIHAKTIPIVYTHSYFPWWLSNFTDRIPTTEDFFILYKKLMNDEREYKKMLFNQEEIDEILKNSPNSMNSVCEFVTECEKDKELCHKRLEEKTQENFSQCLQDCRKKFGCSSEFIIPEDWSGYELTE